MISGHLCSREQAYIYIYMYTHMHVHDSIWSHASWTGFEGNIYKPTPKNKYPNKKNMGFRWFSGCILLSARQEHLAVAVHHRDGGSSAGDLFEHGGVARKKMAQKHGVWFVWDFWVMMLGLEWCWTSSMRWDTLRFHQTWLGKSTKWRFLARKITDKWSIFFKARG